MALPLMSSAFGRHTTEFSEAIEAAAALRKAAKIPRIRDMRKKAKKQ